MADIELSSLEIKTGANTSDKFKLPYNVLADPPDLSVYAKLAGDTFTGDVTFNKKINLGQGDANCLYLGADGRLNGPSNRTLFGLVSGATVFGHQAYPLRFRGSATRPQYTTDGSTYKDLALKSDIPSVPTDYVKYTSQTLTDAQKSQARSNIGAGTSNFSGSYNDLSNKPTIPDISGKLDKTTYEVNKTINFGSSGVLYVGKFKVYDTNITCEITSTTSVTYSGKLVIATQNYVIAQMTVYGDAANTVAPNFFVKPSTTSDPYIEVYFKPSSYSKNVVHIYGSAIAAEPTNVCTNVSAIPSTATSKPTNALDSKANLSGGNTFTGDQHFNAGYYGFEVSNSYDKSFIIEDPAGNYFIAANTDGFSFDDDQLGNYPFLIGGEAGTSGQVLTSQGAGKTPRWTSPAIKSATLTGTTLYLTL